MSQWTHVVGAIRVDGIKNMGADIRKLTEILGPICAWPVWQVESKLPQGSEGGLQYMIYEYGEGLPWTVISIWGDLRDYSDKEEIKQWFEKTLKEITDKNIGFYIIRDAVLRIQVEGEQPVVLLNPELTIEEVLGEDTSNE